MPPDELAKRVLIVIGKNSRDKVRIGQLHVTILRYRRGRRNAVLAFQFPHDEIAEPDQKWNQTY